MLDFAARPISLLTMGFKLEEERQLIIYILSIQLTEKTRKVG